MWLIEPVIPTAPEISYAVVTANVLSGVMEPPAVLGFYCECCRCRPIEQRAGWDPAASIYLCHLLPAAITNYTVVGTPVGGGNPIMVTVAATLQSNGTVRCVVG